MAITRRSTNQLLAAAIAAPGLSLATARRKTRFRYDIAVIGAGVFGAWTAHHLHRRGFRTLLVDAYGPASSRATSGGESRIIRTSYGTQDFYSTWAWHSLPQWQALARRTGQSVFAPTGVLAFADEGNEFIEASWAAQQRLQIPSERLSRSEMVKRYPQVAFGPHETGLYEPHAGVLYARQSVQALVAEMRRRGVDYRQAEVLAPTGASARADVMTRDGVAVSAERFVYACGPWLKTLFPHELGPHLRIDRAEVYFLGAEAGDRRFDGENFPAWMDCNAGADAWGIPGVEGRGFKLAVDHLIQPADPDQQDRQPTAPFREAVRDYVVQRFPALARAPIVETRVCQYEMAEDEEYLVDRHPHYENVWWAGGGSGHGFKNGPELGRYVAGVLSGTRPPESRFQRNVTGA
jgi:sarcosine oxidase